MSTIQNKLLKASQMGMIELEHQVKNWNGDGFCLQCEHCDKLASHFYSMRGYCKEDYDKYAESDDKERFKQNEK